MSDRQQILLLGLFAAISCSVYVVYTSLESGLGFPLDDAWIHHTFARNLAAYGEWSFVPGNPSGASTGPFWGAVLAIFYWLGIDPIWGNYLLGWGMVWALGAAGYRIGKHVLPGSKYGPLLIGSVLVFEWHLVWAALSGMETLLLGLVSLYLLVWLQEGGENWWLPGFLVGLTVWIRPDGLTLIGPVLFCLYFRKHQSKTWLRSLLELTAGLAVFIIFYFLFNKSITGGIWPNTFYAKQAEYAFLYQRSIFSRLGTMSYQIVIGVGIILLPGVLLETAAMVKNRNWAGIGILIWAMGYVMMYSLRLPVAYQHGRYVMPVMPVVFLFGGFGLLRSIEVDARELRARILSKAWIGTAAATLFVFWLLGARSFALDVGVINTEMVRGALWIRDHTPGDAIVAAHDVGALGYFSERDIRDLAGLVMPDVIPFLWDDAQLADYLDAENVDYLFTFTDWYPGLVNGLDVAFQTNGEYAPRFGMEGFAVFYWE